MVTAIISIFKPHWYLYLIPHFNIASFGILVFYIYRNVHPLAIFEGHPPDLDEGWQLWIKVLLLAVVSVVIPLIIPRRRFMDEKRLRVYRQPFPQLEEFPPLCRQDYSYILKEQSFKHLDSFFWRPTETFIH
ncbi:atp-binding cassette transporter [Moniliophthora roreri]|nr:atp-binding cassette transporter [Moniliophthora roreri]